MPVRVKVRERGQERAVPVKREPNGGRHFLPLEGQRRVYLAAEVVTQYGADWTGPAEPAGWAELPALEV